MAPPSTIQGQHRWLHRQSWLPVILTRSGWMCVRLGVSAVWKALAELHSHTKSFSASSDCRRDVRCALRSATQNCFISSVCLSSSIFPSNSAALLCSVLENQMYRWESFIEKPYYNTGQFRNSNYWGIINVIAQIFTFPHWALVESRTGLLWHGTQASGSDKTKGGAQNRVSQERRRLFWIYISLNFSLFLLLCRDAPYFSSKNPGLACYKGNSHHSSAPCSAFAHASHLLTCSKVRAMVCTAEQTDQ